MTTIASSTAFASHISVDMLLTEYRENPLGVDSPKPRFSWRMKSSERGARQTAYQIQVATSKTLLRTGKPDMWNSGKVTSDRCAGIPYGGKALKNCKRYFWRVRVWDQKGSESQFSDAAMFETAFIDPKEWQGRWIAPKDAGSGNGYHSEIAKSVDTTKWVQIDLGKTRRFTAVVLYPARPYNWKHDDPGFGFPARYRLEVSDDADFKDPQMLVDRTGEDQRNPGKEPVKLDVGDRAGRYIRLTATKLNQPREQGPLLALAEMEVLDDKGNNLAYGSAVSALDSIEEHGWSKDRLTDGGRVSRKLEEASPLLRREFTIGKPVSSARAYVSGLGYYELHLNGKKVGDRVLDPPYTNFDKRVYYSVYDVTKLLVQGANCVGAILGHGWWHNTPRFLLQIRITFSDGSTANIVTDDKWKWSQGPILENSIYHGEFYDATKEQKGWNLAGFNDSGWKSAGVVDMSNTQLSAQMIQPIKVTETLAPRKMTQPKPGVYVFDFGQNFSGWCRIKLSGPAGTKVTLRHAELVYPDGTVNQENLRSARATDTYILRGEGQETYEPRFTYHGFRYVQVEGFPGTPNLGSISGRVVHTSFEPRGKFSCSNDLLNRIQHACEWGEKTNFHSIPTDCPQRDERQGWMGDAHMSADAMLYNFDMPPAYIKFLRDIQDAQLPDGSVPDTVPHVWGGAKGDPMWSAAYPLILWDMYRHTGDTSLLIEHYDGIKRYVDSLKREAGEDCIITRNSYGDWIGVVETPKPLISTGGFYLVADLLARIAEVLGKTEDVNAYGNLCKQIAAAFNREFFNPKTRNYGNGSQFSNAFPLYLGIVPPEHHKEVVAALVKDIEDRKGHLSTGFIGTPYLLKVLVNEGRADLAYTIVTREDYPGWGYMIANDATTIWELWELKTGSGMNSHNHPALGLVSGWFYSILAGITPDSEKPGWEHFTIKPYVLGDLKWAHASVNTIRGRVESRWELTERGICMKVSVPAGSEADLFIPKPENRRYEIREGKNVIWRTGEFTGEVDGISGGEDTGKWVSFKLGSGDYVFELAALDTLVPLSTGTLYVPEYYKPQDGSVDLVFHFHGSAERVRDCLIKSGRKAAIITVAYGGLSSRYSKPFSDPRLFGSILAEARQKLAERFHLKDVKIRRLVVSSFSAGFGAVREVLKSPEYESAITDLILADTLYAGYIKKDGKNVVDPKDMAPFEGIAARAAHGEVNFWISYSGVVPPDYASTFETAEYLLNKVGGKLEPASGTEAPHMELVTKADIGSFHVRGYAGNDGPAHMQHLFNLDLFYRRTELE